MPSQDIKSVLQTRPVKFQLKAGNSKWACTVHADRASYERTKGTRADSSASVSTSSSSSTTSSK